MIYADSSFIVSAYTTDANTASALRFLDSHKPRLPIVFLHWPEIAGSFWKSHPDPEKRWSLWEEDLTDRKKIYPLQLDADRTAKLAAGMMKGYGQRWQTLRAIDVMHVSAAIESGARQFLSFDSNSYQRCLAHVQGLKVWPVLTAEETKRLSLPEPVA